MNCPAMLAYLRLRTLYHSKCAESALKCGGSSLCTAPLVGRCGGARPRLNRVSTDQCGAADPDGTLIFCLAGTWVLV